MELSKALQCRWLRERGSEDQHKGKLLGPKDTPLTHCITGISSHILQSERSHSTLMQTSFKNVSFSIRQT